MSEERAEYMRTYMKARRQSRRARLIELLGGCCVRCGVTEGLEFDHIDPNTKRFAVGADLSRAWAELVEEALKTQLLCRPCHVAKGVEDRPEPAHGLYRYWYWCCRCSVCRAANSEKTRRQRARTRIETVGKEWGDHGHVLQMSGSQLPRLDLNQEPAG